MEELTSGYVSSEVSLNTELSPTAIPNTIGNGLHKQPKYNRSTRRKAMYYKGHEYINAIHKTKDIVDKDGNHEAKDVPVAYLNPTKGWRGNKNEIIKAGYKVKRRSTIGR